MRLAIVGGGVSGLTLAHALLRRGARERGLELFVLERAPRPGGNLRSESAGGYLCEAGPNGFLDNSPPTLQLVRELGLESRLLPSDARARKRYVYCGERLHLVPGGPVGFLTSRLLSWRGKLRVAGEPFAPARPEGDETIHDFAARRIGAEAAEALVGSMVSGVFAGDARSLSLRACFPKLWQMESEHGGLVRALVARIRSGRRKGEAAGAPLGRLTSFAGGVEELIHGLARSVGESLRTSAPLSALEETEAGYTLRLAGGGVVRADSVVLACPPRESARLVAGLDSTLAAELRSIESAPLAVISLGYVREQTPALDGFGFLVPRRQGPRALGVLWESSIFPNRAPQGRALLRVMIGGALDPDAVNLADRELVDAARRDLATTIGLTAQPELVRIARHTLGIPQYTVGHLDRLARIDERLARHPGLRVAGNGYRGVAINSCVAEAFELAERLLAPAAFAGARGAVALAL